jgi:hypothetical protein
MPPQESAPFSGIKWDEVTWYSKLGATILFIGVVPTLCFYIGTQYELTQGAVVSPSSVVANSFVKKSSSITPSFQNQWQPISSTTKDWSIENGKIYYAGYVYANPDEGHVLVKGDINTFVVSTIRTDYSKDKYNVFVCADMTAGETGVPVDPATFNILKSDTSYATDKNGVYFLDSVKEGCGGAEMIPNADPVTFAPLDDLYAKDNGHVYFLGSEVQGADAASFKLFDSSKYGGGVDAQDKYNDYFQGKPLLK